MGAVNIQKNIKLTAPVPTVYTLAKNKGALKAMIFSMIIEAWVMQGGRM